MPRTEFFKVPHPRYWPPWGIPWAYPMEWLATGRKGRIAEPESIYGDNASVSQETWRAC